MINRILSVRETGKHHRIAGKPSQDQSNICRSGGKLLLSAADGHGGKMYTRSSMGARLALYACRKVLLEQDLPVQERAAAVKALFDHLVERELERFPPAEDELDGLNGSPACFLYGTTVIAVLAEKEHTFALHLGDGELYIYGPDGRAFPALPQDPRCFGGGTSSLVTADAVQHMRWAQWDVPAAAVLLHTDGFSPSRPPFALLRLLSEGKDRIPEEILATGRHTDDLTLVAACDADAAASGCFLEGVRTEEDQWNCRVLYEQAERRRRELAEFLRLALHKLETTPAGASREQFLRLTQEYFTEYKALDKLLHTSSLHAVRSGNT